MIKNDNGTFYAKAKSTYTCTGCAGNDTPHICNGLIAFCSTDDDKKSFIFKKVAKGKEA